MIYRTVDTQVITIGNGAGEKSLLIVKVEFEEEIIQTKTFEFDINATESEIASAIIKFATELKGNMTKRIEISGVV